MVVVGVVLIVMLLIDGGKFFGRVLSRFNKKFIFIGNKEFKI